MTTNKATGQSASIKLFSAIILLQCLICSQFVIGRQTLDDRERLLTPIEMRKAPEMDAQSVALFNSHFKVSETENRSLQFFPDSVVVYSVQANPRKYNYLFSNKGELLTILVRIRQGAVWVNESIENRTYDALSNMTIQHWQGWNGSAWINTSRNLFTYDNSRKILSLTEQNWNPTTGSWVNFRRTTNTWSASGLQLTMLQEFFSGDNWVNQVFELYVYQDNNLIQAERQTWINGNWANQYQYFYTYDGQANLTSMTMKQWTGNQWNDFYREVFYYNTTNQLTIYVSQQFNSSWQNSEQYFYTYDPLGFLETAQRQLWQSGNWQNSLRRSFTNNNYGSFQLALNQVWQQNDWANQQMFTKGFDENGNSTTSDAFVWANGWQQSQDNQIEINYNFGLKTLRFQGYRALAGFTSMLVETPEDMVNNQIIVYPNPSNGKFFIFNEILSSDVVSIHIFALDGKKVFKSQLPSASLLTVDIRNEQLKPGVYVLRIASSKETKHHHIILN